MEKPLQFTFVYSEQIIRRTVFRFWLRRYFSLRESILLALMLIGSIVFGIKRLNGIELWLFLPLIVLWSLLFWIARFRILIKLWRSKMRAFRELNEGRMTLRVEEGGLTFCAKMDCVTMPWNTLMSIWRFPDALVLLWGPMEFSFLPLEQLTEALNEAILQHAPKNRVEIM